MGLNEEAVTDEIADEQMGQKLAGNKKASNRNLREFVIFGRRSTSQTTRVRRRSSSLGEWGRDFGRGRDLVGQDASFLNQDARSATKSFHDSGSSKAQWLSRAVVWGLRGIVGGFLFSVFLVAVYAVIPVPVTPLMMIRVIESVADRKPVPWNKDWVPLERISPRLQAAVIAAEDARFLEHYGFDFEAIDKAMKYNRRSTRRVRGASTISQQVAKNVFLWPSRSWVRKGFEVYFTSLIELLWSKRRILEVYLNVVEFGDGVYGAEAAARKFFKKPSGNLTRSEAALMAAVLPNPRRFSIAKPSGYVRFRQVMIQRRMPNVGLPSWP